MPSQKLDFDKAAASWDDEPRRLKLAEDVCAAILKNVGSPAGMDALDYGCGTGLVTLGLQPHIHSITGIDTSEGMLGVLRKKVEKLKLCNVQIQNIDLQKEDALNRSYDLITSNMTMHHIKDIRPLLDIFFKHMLPNGHICISDLDLEGGLFHENNEGVFHFGFDRNWLREVFIEAGFTDVHAQSVAEMNKPDGNGEMRRFGIFLIAGRKRI
ncbi:Ubiquinone biosynthesis O-methyltransferase [uncultured archaeon]|nr:Ubiquinone biosynthesis O-methyltransferase [uncultured archaeon]